MQQRAGVPLLAIAVEGFPQDTAGAISVGAVVEGDVDREAAAERRSRHPTHVDSGFGDRKN